MTDERYMNGRGLLKRTEELNDAMWDALPMAFIGTSAAVLGPFISWGVFIHRFPWDLPPPEWFLWAFIIISTLSVSGGIWVSLPWWKAGRAIKRHTKMMKQETAKRGERWAED